MSKSFLPFAFVHCRFVTACSCLQISLDSNLTNLVVNAIEHRKRCHAGLGSKTSIRDRYVRIRRLVRIRRPIIRRRPISLIQPISTSNSFTEIRTTNSNNFHANPWPYRESTICASSQMNRGTVFPSTLLPAIALMLPHLQPRAGKVQQDPT